MNISTVLMLCMINLLAYHIWNNPINLFVAGVCGGFAIGLIAYNLDNIRTEL